MFVLKPIGSIKVGNTNSRLTVGKPVPENVLKHWEKNGELEDLKKLKVIGDKIPKKTSDTNGKKDVVEKSDKKEKEKEDESFFKNEGR